MGWGGVLGACGGNPCSGSKKVNGSESEGGRASGLEGTRRGRETF